MEFVPKEILNSPDFNKIIVLAQIDNAVRGIYFGEQPDWVNVCLLYTSDAADEE